MLQEAEAIQSSVVPPEMQSCPVEELMDYVAGHLIDWSEAHQWCAACSGGQPHPALYSCLMHNVRVAAAKVFTAGHH